MDKRKEIAESIRRDHNESLIGFDETPDYRTFVHRIIYNDYLGTIPRTDPPLRSHLFGDGLELNCPMRVYTFKRNVAIPKLCDLRESLKLFLRSGARPGGAPEENVEIVVQIRETSQAQFAKVFSWRIAVKYSWRIRRQARTIK
jgi:hypothetical protein